MKLFAQDYFANCIEGYSDEGHSINCSDSILVIPIVNITNIINSVVIMMAWHNPHLHHNEELVHRVI